MATIIRSKYTFHAGKTTDSNKEIIIKQSDAKHSESDTDEYSKIFLSQISKVVGGEFRNLMTKFFQLWQSALWKRSVEAEPQWGVNYPELDPELLRKS